jgi:hypothetical protein
MKTTAAIALALAAGAGSAGAETPPEPYAGVTIEQLYDSNVMNSHGADMVTRVTPRLGVYLESPVMELSAEYRVGLHAYAFGTAEGSVNHRGSLRLRRDVSRRLEVHAGAIFLRADDPVLLDRANVAVPHGGFTDLEVMGGLAWKATRRLSLEGEYNFRLSRFDAADAVDGEEHRLDLRGRQRLTRRLDLTIGARGQHFVSHAMDADLGTAAGAVAGLKWQLTHLFRIEGEAGPVWFVDEGEWTWSALARGTYTAQRTRFSLIGARDLYGGTGAQGAVWAESLQLGASWLATRHLFFRVRGGVYRTGAAPDEATSASGLVGHADAGWILNRHLRIDLYAEHRAQDTEGGTTFGDIHRTVAGIRLVAVAGSDLTEVGEIP